MKKRMILTDDDQTRGIIVIGEILGTAELDAAESIKQDNSKAEKSKADRSQGLPW